MSVFGAMVDALARSLASAALPRNGSSAMTGDLLVASGVNVARAAGSATGEVVVFGVAPSSADANVGVALVPKGNGALTAAAPDGTTANGGSRGNNAVDWQQVRSTPGQIAGGSGATIGGGSNNTAGGTSSTVAGGSTNAATSGASWVPGGQQATTRGDIHRGAWSAGRFAANGDAQAGEFLLRRQTTDATPTRLTADNGTPGSGNSVTVPANGGYTVKLLVEARQTGGSAGAAGDGADWEITARLSRGASAASVTLDGCIALSPTGIASGGTAIPPLFTKGLATAWRLTVAADTTLGSLAVSASGEANKTILWAARVLSVECTG
jgi:hypothetical protein